MADMEFPAFIASIMGLVGDLLPPALKSTVDLDIEPKTTAWTRLSSGSTWRVHLFRDAGLLQSSTGPIITVIKGDAMRGDGSASLRWPPGSPKSGLMRFLLLPWLL